MVLEAILSPLSAERRPWKVGLVGFLYAAFALALSLWIFEDYAGLVSIFLVVIAALPFVHDMLSIEERRDLSPEGQPGSLSEHSRALEALLFFFAGCTVAYLLSYLTLPEALLAKAFAIQRETIAAINVQATATAALSRIISNNLKVLTFSIIFSFFYGAGALFVLTWNASIIATAMGGVMKPALAAAATKLGWAKAASYLSTVTLGVGRYVLHGAPEIAAYFFAMLAGGMLGVAFSQRDWRSPRFEKLLLHAVDMVLLALGLIVLASLIEVYITPIIFS